LNLLDENGQSIPTILILEDGSILAQIGNSYDEGHVVRIQDRDVTTIPDTQFIGRSPDRRYFAIARQEGVQVLDGWNGPEVALCPWPTGQENLPAEIKVHPIEGPLEPTRLIPFPDGKKVLLVSEFGIYILSETRTILLLPTTDSLKEQYEWHKEDYPGEPFGFSICMEHGAVSLDGKLIAVGDQGSNHLIFDDHGALIGDIGVQSFYPHYALFSADDQIIAFNSCHLYNGITVGVPTNLLPGFTTESNKKNESTPILEEVSRIYGGVSRDNEFIIGNADGYLLCFNKKGEHQWEHFIGSSIGSMDISPDGKTLVVSTYAGYISIINLDAGTQPAYQIGTGNHEEIRRWLFWKNEPKPLIW